MICEYCGKEISDNAVICPLCGGVSSSTSARPAPNPTTTYGDYPPEAYNNYHDLSPTSTYDQGYAGQTNFTETPPQAGYSPQAGEYGYRPSYTPPPRYQMPPANMTTNNTMLTRETSSGALLAEIIFSLFGVYGIGWLMAGETTIGTILLICSFVLIWPLAILIAIFTLGFGIIFCDLPLAIIGIIINAVLLNNTLNRKMLPPVFPTVPPQPIHTPPQQMPPQ